MCYQIINESTVKVRPGEFFIRRKTISIQLAGKGFTCSPLGAIYVGLQPSCDDDGNCLNTQACISRQAPQRKDLHICDYHCVTPTDWAFAVVFLGHIAAGP